MNKFVHKHARGPFTSRETPGSCNTACKHHSYSSTNSGESSVLAVRISQPESVMSSVCSNWALRLPSAVTTVHPSGHIASLCPPRLIMGSMVKVWPFCNATTHSEADRAGQARALGFQRSLQPRRHACVTGGCATTAEC